jgi:WD40 repeat protein
MAVPLPRVSLLVGFVLTIQCGAWGAPPVPIRTDAYGDPLPKGVRFRLGSVRLRHDGDVMALAWMPDGRTLVSAGWDRTIRLWQIPGGKLLAKWDKMDGAVFSPDGRRFACGEGEEKMVLEDAERAIRIVDAATGKERRRIRVVKNGGTLFNFTPGYACGIISPDGKLLAVREGTLGVRLYALDSGKELRYLEAKVLEFGRPLVFAPDSRTLLVSTDEGVYRWMIGTGAKEKVLEDKEGPAFHSSFAISPDGKLLAVEDHRNGGISLRSWPAGKELHRLELNDGIIHDIEVLAFSPDGKLLAAAEYGTIRLWNPATGKQVRHFSGYGGNEIWDLAFSPDGSLLASAGSDNAVIVWEVRAGKAPRPLTGVNHWLYLAGLAPDGQSLLTLSADDVLTLWDSRDGRRLCTRTNGEDAFDNLLFGPDIGRKRALLRNKVESGRYREAFGKESNCHTAFSPDNAMMAVGGHKGILLVRKGYEYRLLDDEDRIKNAKDQRITISVSALTFSPDGRTLAACYTDGRLFLWNPHTGRPRHILCFPKPLESYRSLEFSPDGRLLALCDRLTLSLVESASGQKVRELPLNGEWVDSLAFAPDNRTFAFGAAQGINRAADSGNAQAHRVAPRNDGRSRHLLRMAAHASRAASSGKHRLGSRAASPGRSIARSSRGEAHARGKDDLATAGATWGQTLIARAVFPQVPIFYDPKTPSKTGRKFVMLLAACH